MEAPAAGGAGGGGGGDASQLSSGPRGTERAMQIFSHDYQMVGITSTTPVEGGWGNCDTRATYARMFPDGYANVYETFLPVLKMTGRCEDGSTMCIVVHGYLPYMYIPIRDNSHAQEIIQSIGQFLETSYRKGRARDDFLAGDGGGGGGDAPGIASEEFMGVQAHAMAGAQGFSGMGESLEATVERVRGRPVAETARRRSLAFGSGFIHDVAVLKRIDVYGYRKVEGNFAKVTFSRPQFVSAVREALVGDHTAPDRYAAELAADGKDYGMPTESFRRPPVACAGALRELGVERVYEASVPFTLRHSVDRGVVVGGWAEVTDALSTQWVIGDGGGVCNPNAARDRSVYRIDDAGHGSNLRVSNCTHEYHVYDNSASSTARRGVVFHDPSERPEWIKYAPIKVMSVDGEMIAEKDKFPDPTVRSNRCIVIASSFYTMGKSPKGDVQSMDRAVIQTLKPTPSAASYYDEEGSPGLARGARQHRESMEEARQELKRLEEEHQAAGDDMSAGGETPAEREERIKNYKRRLKETEIANEMMAASDKIEIRSYRGDRDEFKMLHDFFEMIRREQPDVIMGWNSNRFDMVFFIKRYNLLRPSGSPPLTEVGRFKFQETVIRTEVKESKAFGKRELIDITIGGVVLFDLLERWMRDHKERSYRLDSVSDKYLCIKKLDVHHSAIRPMYESNDPAQLLELAMYCLKDTVLPWRLAHVMSKLTSLVELCRVTCLPPHDVLNGGQQRRVFSRLLRKARADGYIVPYIPVNEEGLDEKFEGATVIEPTRGFYTNPVTTLDFASLYPSIMLAHNLCYTTWVTPEEAASMPEEDYTVTPCGEHFVRPHVRKGILMEILEYLLSCRKAAKADMKAASKRGDEFEASVHDGRQAALKVICNSVYGFTGAKLGLLPMLEISTSVTSFGRQMIMITKSFVELEYEPITDQLKEAKRRGTLRVIYGDTDSVMIDMGYGVGDFPGDTEAERKRNMIEATKREGLNMVAEINRSKFIKPINLEWEKVFNPYLLINKKRYAGLLWTRSECYDYMSVRGLESVRRDNCMAVKNSVNRALDILLRRESVEDTLTYVDSVLSDLRNNRIDLEDLVISKQLSRDPESYKNKRQAHLELLEKIKEKTPDEVPNVGDRIPYVIVRPRNKKLTQREVASLKHSSSRAESLRTVREDPEHWAVDVEYYLENQFAKPLGRLVGSALGDQEIIDNFHKTVKATGSCRGLRRFVQASAAKASAPGEGGGAAAAAAAGGGGEEPSPKRIKVDRHKLVGSALNRKKAAGPAKSEKKHIGPEIGDYFQKKSQGTGDVEDAGEVAAGVGEPPKRRKVDT